MTSCNELWSATHEIDWLIVSWNKRTNISEIKVKIQKMSLLRMHLYMSPAKWRPFCPGEISYCFLGGLWWRRPVDITALSLCTYFQNNLTTNIDVMDERNFLRFELKMRFGGIYLSCRSPCRSCDSRFFVGPCQWKHYVINMHRTHRHWHKNSI